MHIHDLVAHKAYADAAMLSAVRQHPRAATDGDLRVLFHHTLVANRFWLLAIVDEPFVPAVETCVPASIEELVTAFRTTHEREAAWVADSTAAALSRTLESPLIPGGRCLVSDALTQVCLHSQGHRAQAAKMLRALGGHPPTTDFIVWLVERAEPRWTD